MTAIAINGRFMTRPPNTTDRFATQLLRAWLSAFGRVSPVRVLVPSRSQVRTRHSLGVRVEPVGLLSGHAWEQTELAGHVGGDLLVGLSNTGPMTLRRQLVVLHDTGIFVSPSMYGFAARNWYRRLLSRLVRTAGTIATVSASSASDIMKHAGARAARIEVIHGAGEHMLAVAPDPRVFDRLKLSDRRYILALGGQAPNRNFEAITKAGCLLTGLDASIIAVGGARNRVVSATRLQAGNIIPTDYVSDGELRALYARAECIVVPSFHEGFPLAALEAMQCGCPVVASHSSSLPEVCGNAAAYCDPSDPVDIAGQLRRLVESRSLRAELRDAGYARVRAFSWSRSAEQLQRAVLIENSTGADARRSATGLPALTVEEHHDSWRPSAIHAAEAVRRQTEARLREVLRQ